jgi:hypothetical protein
MVVFQLVLLDDNWMDGSSFVVGANEALPLGSNCQYMTWHKQLMSLSRLSDVQSGVTLRLEHHGL